MKEVRGTAGYAESLELFYQTSLSLPFNEVCKDFLPFLPPQGASVLDVGCGVGQNAAALADLGFNVTTEPDETLLNKAKSSFHDKNINWYGDSLPLLSSINNKFDFVFLEGVWHHLDATEQVIATKALAQRLNNDGMCAISLRNGPAGVGRCVFPTNSTATLAQFESLGLKCKLHLQNKASLLPKKSAVRWSRIVVQK